MEAGQSSSNPEPLTFCHVDFQAFEAQECLRMKSLPDQRNDLNRQRSGCLKIELSLQSGRKRVGLWVAL